MTASGWGELGDGRIKQKRKRTHGYGPQSGNCWGERGIKGWYGNGENIIKIIYTSGQDGDVGRYTVPPRTTKRRTTTNLKTKNNKNFQKIKLYGSPTTKELKKKHSSRLVGGVKRTHGKVVAGGLGC